VRRVCAKGLIGDWVVYFHTVDRPLLLRFFSHPMLRIFVVDGGFELSLVNPLAGKTRYQNMSSIKHQSSK
jgi:hypothetical protein